MKKIILSAMLVLSSAAFAQQPTNDLSAPPIKTQIVKAPEVLKATWQDKEYVLTEKDVKANKKYKVSFNFYDGNKLLNSYTLLELANFPNALSDVKTIDYVSAVSNGKKTKTALQYGVAVTAVVIPSEDDDDSVILRSYAQYVDLVSIKKHYDTNNVDYIELPETRVMMQNLSNLVPVGREVIINKVGSLEMRVLVKLDK